MHIFQQPESSCVLALLSQCGLPASDLGREHMELFLGCGDEAAPGGVIGLEIHGRLGLLRSLAVASGDRKCGCGRTLVTAIEEIAAAKGLESIYLLTDTAEKYFSTLGYIAVERNKVPEEIQKTSEFSSLCPDSAVVMKKDLD